MPDIESARKAALAAARDIMCDEVTHGRLCLACRIDVEDAGGGVVLTVPFDEAVTITGQRSR